MKENELTKLGRATKGYVVAKMKPRENVKDGIALPVEGDSIWGEVVSIGPPLAGLNSPWEMFKYRLFKIHPWDVRRGEFVLLPSVGGSRFTRGGDQQYMVFLQQDIKVAYDAV